MDPLELIECSETQYGQFIELDEGENMGIAKSMLNEMYHYSVEQLKLKGLEPIGKVQIIEHTKEQNKEVYKEIATLGWKQNFRKVENAA